uniref:Uncharacterized protein n=1 Tax=Meloidogyne enterolobii TaxID=390850 RepID=A0A6V7YES3_MELEN|nr:unnamed protein product [Meloidogyne enterolobii]
MPAQDEIFRNIRVVAQGLDALRDEHEAIKNKLTGGIDLLTPDERQLIDEKTSIVDRNLENILLGVEEAQVMVALASHFQNLEADKQKYKAQVRRLCQENAWIRDELNSTQQQLRTAMQNIAQLEEENKHLKFMNSIKKFDEDLPELADKEGDQAEQQHTASDVHNSTLQELGFGDEEEDLQSLFLSYFDFHKNIDWGKGLGWYVDCVILAIIKQDAMLVRNAVILLENKKESLRKAIRKLKLENGRMKLKIKTLNEKVGKLTNEKLVDVDDGRAPESEYDYDDLNRDFYLIGGIHDPLSLRCEVTIRDKEGIEHKSAERFYW